MQKRRYKKILIITLVVVGIITSAITYGVVTFLNSPKMKLAGIVQKIPKIEKGDGTYSIDARVHVEEGAVEVGIQNGTLSLARKIDDKQITPENFLKATGQVYAKADGDRNLRMVAKYINNEKGEWILTKDFTLSSSFLDMKTTQTPAEEVKNVLSKVFVVSKQETQTQEETLQTFLLKGYDLPITEQEHKPAIVITKSEIIKAFHKAEENVRADRQKFITLLQKQDKKISSTDAEKLASSLADGEAFKHVDEMVFSKVSEFYFAILFEEKSKDTINISMELKCSGKTTVFNKETGINLDVKTSMNYKVMS